MVVRCTADGPLFLLIHDIHRNWGFPKGHLHEGEGPEQAAVREVQEETGLDNLSIIAPLGTINWYFRFRGRLIHKYCHFFLMQSAAGDPVPQAEEGISECRWSGFEDARERLTHANARGVLERAETLARQLCGVMARDG